MKEVQTFLQDPTSGEILAKIQELVNPDDKKPMRTVA